MLTSGKANRLVKIVPHSNGFAVARNIYKKYSPDGVTSLGRRAQLLQYDFGDVNAFY